MHLIPLINSDCDNGHNDDSEEKVPPSLIYRLSGYDRNGSMLPNSQKTASTYLGGQNKGLSEG